MHTLTSKDRTKIAYDVQGHGPALIIVPGALNTRNFRTLPHFYEILAKDFTVFSFDRRGRGDSGDTLPYAVEREIEDIGALADAAGGSAFLCGFSSGAALALLAAAGLGTKIRKLAMYEAPWNDDPQARAVARETSARLATLLAEGKRGDAVALFMRFVGMPDNQVAGMRQSPAWPDLEKIAHTLAYDVTAVLGPDSSLPGAIAARVTVPALVMYGSASYPFMKTTAETLGRVMPLATLRVLEGQTHDVSPEALAPVLAEFFLGR